MSSIKKYFLISCEEAKQICDKMQYGEATFWEKMKLKFRLMWCDTTKSYSEKNGKLTKLCNEAKLKSLDAQKKEEMKKKISTGTEV
ncbi:hypothetical protein OOZ15_14390 [Galbibacter sp. EGI 63066]|uniref:hypothetical protein n=1 Tax=Galbibacter sp. EGI 63066 TaxID=2993559 RepID=UPI00224926BC|nr:hypothetical protein [Galbibacter sp. EGI 63066]MCX2681137.1 hypothetical protein [Galbibacter sp. EGI 63066]